MQDSFSCFATAIVETCLVIRIRLAFIVLVDKHIHKIVEHVGGSFLALAVATATCLDGISHRVSRKRHTARILQCKRHCISVELCAVLRYASEFIGAYSFIVASQS